MVPEGYKNYRQSKVPLHSRLKLKNIFPGEWDSIYTGEGIEFADIKPYEPGDDLRDLDLIALVQSGEEEIIRRNVGRRMRIFIWADLSGSMRRYREMFLSSKPDIRDIAVGLLAYSGFNCYTPVGLCTFDSEIRTYMPPVYGEDYCEKIREKVAECDYKYINEPADVEKAVNFMILNAYEQSIIFYISDFKGPAFDGDFTDLLRPLKKKFDFVPIVIRDPIEENAVIKRPITIVVRDSEGDGRNEFYLTPKKLEEIQKTSAAHLKHVIKNFQLSGIDHVVLDSPKMESCYKTLIAFFEGRKRIRV
jgi:uncharacterized protein (DUF58 family)